MSGYPTVGGMPNLYLYDWLPVVYAETLNVEFYNSTVITQITNTRYQGLIQKQGSKVIIRTQPPLVTNRHTKGQPLNIQRPQPGSIEMPIDKGQYFAFEVESVDRAQSDLNAVQLWSEHASEILKVDVDTWFLSDVYASAHASNSGATAGVKYGNINLGALTAPFEVTPANVMDFITDAGEVLDQQNVPQTARFFVAPPWFISCIKKSDLKDASLAGDGTSIWRNGLVGMCDRFKMYMSNSLYDTLDSGSLCTNALFGHSLATSFAAQITESKTIDMGTAGFGEIMKQLQVFDWKVTKPEALGHAYVVKG